MNVLVDFHCHIYKVYDLRKALNFVVQRHSTPIAMFLTERNDCSYFTSISEKKIELTADFDIKIVDENCCKLNEKIFLFRGRQYATKEGVEVLSLFTAPDLADKLPARTYCEAIVRSGGVIAFSWAFGKWRGNRTAMIEELLLEYGNKKAILLDSRLRPNILARPSIFNKLTSNGFKVFVGSDPLPLKGQENKLASYTSLFEIPESDLSVINSEFLRDLIFNKESTKVVGSRSGLLEFVRDQLALRI
jgi:hypothetical protein